MKRDKGITVNWRGVFQFNKYLNAMCAGMCFEYAYRVDSDVWYLPLLCGVCITIIMAIDSFKIDE